MQVKFKPTGYQFTFDDVYFVQVKLAGAYAQGGYPFIACFTNYSDAHAFAEAQVKRDDVDLAWVFTRERAVSTHGSPSTCAAAGHA